MSDQDKIKQKIFHLLQKTVDNGATEHEALQAAKKAGELMDQYNINISDVEIRDTKCVQHTIETGATNRVKIDGCMSAIAQYCDVKIWFTKGKNSKYNIFGLNPDVEMFKYLYQIINNAYNNSLKEFKNSSYYNSLSSGEKRSATTSFGHSFSTRIYYRLKEMKQKRDDDMNEQTGRQVVVVKHETVQEEFKKANVKLKKVYHKTTTKDFVASTQGKKAADNVKILNPVSSNTNNRIGIV